MSRWPVFYRAAGLILLSETFLVFSGMLVKLLSGEMHTAQIVFGRNFLGLVILLPWAFYVGATRLRTEHLNLHLVRAFVGVSAMTCMFYSWGHLPLAQAALFKQTSPFFVPFIAYLWLKESIQFASKLAILIGFVGVVFVLDPSGGQVNIAIVVAVIGAMLGAAAKVSVRRMHTTESSKHIVFYYALLSTCIMAVPAYLVWTPPSMNDVWLVLAMAITSTIAQLLLSKAYGMANAGALAPFTFASVAVAALVGWVVWAEVLTLFQWVGMLVIAFAGLIATQTKRFSRGIVG